MKDPIEERLERLQPAPLPNDLMARLISARPQPAATPPPLPWRIRWLGREINPIHMLAGGLIAAIISLPLLKSVQDRKLRLQNAVPVHVAASTPKPTRIFLPVEQRNYLVRADDLGIIGADSPHPVRLVRTVWVDDTTFRGTDGISHARLTQPREQIIPVSLETY